VAVEIASALLRWLSLSKPQCFRQPFTCFYFVLPKQFSIFRLKDGGKQADTCMIYFQTPPKCKNESYWLTAQNLSAGAYGILNAAMWVNQKITID
jgi:hypothetical protein